MIGVDTLVYELDMKLNKVSGLQHQVIPIENKIIALNQAQIKLIKVKLDPNNPLGLGLDAFKKRYEDLEILVEREKDHPLDLVLTDPLIFEWTTDLSTLKPAYMFYVDSYLTANKGVCKNKVIYVNRGLAKHADVLTLLNNTNYRPSFEYEETFPIISGFKISVFTDGTFDPVKLYVSYIRYPVEIDFPGYVKFDGSNSTKVDCELNDYLKEELLNYAVEELAEDTENIPAAQFVDRRIKTSE